MNIAIISVCSDAYLPNYKILYKSIITHIPNITPILYYTGKNVLNGLGAVIDASPWLTHSLYTNDFYKHCSIRPKAILDAFSRGYDAVLLMGADTEFFAYPYEAINALHNNEAFITMYLHEPLSDNGKWHNNLQVLDNGQIQADFIGFKNTPKVQRFLQWVDVQVKTKCQIGNKVMVDQVWLSFCFSFLDSVYICRHLGYNVGSYNVIERCLKWENNKGELKDGSELVLYHYDGLEKGKEENVSKHQNRHKAKDDLLQFLKEYTSKL